MTVCFVFFRRNCRTAEYPTAECRRKASRHGSHRSTFGVHHSSICGSSGTSPNRRIREFSGRRPHSVFGPFPFPCAFGVPCSLFGVPLHCRSSQSYKTPIPSCSSGQLPSPSRRARGSSPLQRSARSTFHNPPRPKLFRSHCCGHLTRAESARSDQMTATSLARRSLWAQAAAVPLCVLCASLARHSF